ncbi:uncharacterized protein STEHIDRAFT_100265 [Stereum hirsutum FP-91666 SS1]|uniref:uncharacterized protein n=1 Tax=Stereum hirsutum (strain FP-91666) TaxID=721885 RepID=UPI0004449F5B|nr:uncharacterized protein STEHIDRAFT_100265 [Stereum hirsutum FP-91666 SS1]EIM84246.1 hypothetical protein STEHIDRAFT_100265 [Stereum hirsutum FP-91666 SS1]
MHRPDTLPFSSRAATLLDLSHHSSHQPGRRKIVMLARSCSRLNWTSRTLRTISLRPRFARRIMRMNIEQPKTFSRRETVLCCRRRIGDESTSGRGPNVWLSSCHDGMVPILSSTPSQRSLSILFSFPTRRAPSRDSMHPFSNDIGRTIPLSFRIESSVDHDPSLLRMVGRSGPLIELWMREGEGEESSIRFDGWVKDQKRRGGFRVQRWRRQRHSMSGRQRRQNGFASSLINCVTFLILILIFFLPSFLFFRNYTLISEGGRV